MTHFWQYTLELIWLCINLWSIQIARLNGPYIFKTVRTENYTALEKSRNFIGSKLCILLKFWTTLLREPCFLSSFCNVFQCGGQLYIYKTLALLKYCLYVYTNPHENIWKYRVSATKTFINLLHGKRSCFQGSFVSATMFYEVDKQENIDKKHNVFAMFYTLYYKSIRFILPPTNKFIAILTCPILNSQFFYLSF